jgi:methylase of polypeptide subunit release factors
VLKDKGGGQEATAAVKGKGGGRKATAAVKGQGGGRKATAAVWAAVSGISPGEAWLRRDEPKSPETVAKFHKAVSRLERGIPFAYAVGWAGFRTLDLAIDARALIPRPETEGLVELILKEIGKRETGSGKRGIDQRGRRLGC